LPTNIESIKVVKVDVQNDRVGIFLEDSLDSYFAMMLYLDGIAMLP
jgi:hypothetical protein